MKYLIIMTAFIQCVFAMPTMTHSQKEDLPEIKKMILKDFEALNLSFDSSHIYLDRTKSTSGYPKLTMKIKQDDQVILEESFVYRSKMRAWAAHACADRIIGHFNQVSPGFTRRLAFIDPDHPTIIMQTDVFFNTPMVLFEAPVPIIALGWSNQASLIAFVLKYNDHYELRSFNQKTKENSLIFKSKQPLGHPTWSMNRQTLFFTQVHHGDSKLMAWSKNRTKSISFGNSLDLMPTMTTSGLIYVSLKEGQSYIMRRNPDGLIKTLYVSNDLILEPQQMGQSLFFMTKHDKTSVLNRLDLTSQQLETLKDFDDAQAFTMTFLGPLVASKKTISLFNEHGELQWKKDMAVNWLSMMGSQ
tara:strand:- start:528 stop:1601 length:1074 start_codon:yes stop_codon:yes gene_type:complete